MTSSLHRFADLKVCKKPDCAQAGIAQPSANFQRLRGGGTMDVCKACFKRTMSKSMLQKHAEAREAFAERQKKHFAEDLKREQERWDSLPDGHPYKAPRRPGSKDDDSEGGSDD